MDKHKWEKAWEEKKFKIDTFIPSILVSKYEKLLNLGDKVLDIGCGNGRNSIYLANKGYKVDCFDIADLDWFKKIPQKTQENINFNKSNILKYQYRATQYRVIIITRVIQYLNNKELHFLLEKIKFSIRPDGFLLLSYNTKGGIFNKKDIDVPKYSYPIEDIKILLKTIFKKVIIKEGGKKSRHVNYNDDILSFDIFASNPYIINKKVNTKILN